MADELLSRLGRHQRESLDEAPPAVPDDAALAEDERDALLDAVFGRVDAAEPEPEAEAEPEKVVELASRRPTVSPAAPRSRGRLLPLVVPLVAAALALVWWRVQDPAEEPQLAQIPQYEVSRLQGGVAGTRSEPRPDAPPTLRPDSPIDWVFTPASPVRAPLGVALVAEPHDGGEASLRLVPEAEISADGAVRLRGPLDQFVPLDPGSWRLRVLVGEAGQLPGELKQLEAREAAGGPAPWQSIELEILVR